jgi:hypothetical protein
MLGGADGHIGYDIDLRGFAIVYHRQLIWDLGVQGYKVSIVLSKDRLNSLG